MPVQSRNSDISSSTVHYWSNMGHGIGMGVGCQAAKVFQVSAALPQAHVFRCWRARWSWLELLERELSSPFSSLYSMAGVGRRESLGYVMLDLRLLREDHAIDEWFVRLIGYWHTQETARPVQTLCTTPRDSTLLFHSRSEWHPGRTKTPPKASKSICANSQPAHTPPPLPHLSHLRTLQIWKRSGVRRAPGLIDWLWLLPDWGRLPPLSTPNHNFIRHAPPSACSQPNSIE